MFISTIKIWQDTDVVKVLAIMSRQLDDIRQLDVVKILSIMLAKIWQEVQSRNYKFWSSFASAGQPLCVITMRVCIFELTGLILYRRSKVFCRRSQSDIIHQSVFELIHSEDREQFKLQLNWRSALNPDLSDMSMDQTLLPGLYMYIISTDVSSCV